SSSRFCSEGGLGQQLSVTCPEAADMGSRIVWSFVETNTPDGSGYIRAELDAQLHRVRIDRIQLVGNGIVVPDSYGQPNSRFRLRAIRVALAIGQGQGYGVFSCLCIGVGW